MYVDWRLAVPLLLGDWRGAGRGGEEEEVTGSMVTDAVLSSEMERAEAREMESGFCLAD